MKRLSSFCLLLALSSASACGSTATSPTTENDTYALLGSVAAAVDGVAQQCSHTFLLPTAKKVTITLTSAVETMLDGTANSTVTLGLGLGTVVNNVCTVTPGAYVTAAGSTTAQMAWPMAAGTNCVLVSDVTMQEGPVAYQISMTLE